MRTRMSFVCAFVGASSTAVLVTERPVDAQVPEIAVPGLPDIAVTLPTPRGPIIQYNPILCQRIGPIVCKYARLHEYGHVSLGHVYSAWTSFSLSGRAQAEGEADCFAAARLTDSEVRVVIAFWRSPTVTSDPVHGSPAERAARIARCHSPSTPPTARGDSCEYANDGECDEPDVCRPGTDTTDCRGRDARQQPRGADSCEYANDGECDEPSPCPPGTDTTDCGAQRGRAQRRRSAGGQADSCQYANDGECDEPDICSPGTDSSDCQNSPRGGTRRAPYPTRPPPFPTAAAVCMTPYGSCPMAVRVPIGMSCACPSVAGPVAGVAR